MLTDGTDTFGSALDVLGWRLGQCGTDQQPAPQLPTDGYILDDAGNNLADASGNKFVWANNNP